MSTVFQEAFSKLVTNFKEANKKLEVKSFVKTLKSIGSKQKVLIKMCLNFPKKYPSRDTVP
jgi:hypothetical protein